VLWKNEYFWNRYLKFTGVVFGLFVAKDVIEPHPASNYIHFTLRHIVPFHVLAGLNIAASKIPAKGLRIGVQAGLVGLAGMSAFGLLIEDFRDDSVDANSRPEITLSGSSEPTSKT
jgi:hypothetical protein